MFIIPFPFPRAKPLFISLVVAAPESKLLAKENEYIKKKIEWLDGMVLQKT